MSEKVDFEELKRATTIEAVAQWLGLDWKRANNQLRTRCPLGDGGDRSLVVTPAEDAFYCHSPSCRCGGGMLDLIAHVHQVPLREAALQLKHHLWPERELEELTYLVPVHKAVQELKIPPHVAQALGIGFAPKGTMAGCVLFPLRDRSGKLVGYLGVGSEIKVPRRFFL